MLNIVLYEPEIPYNTGNIGRTCVASDTRLHLIKPLGFSLDQKEIKRAGLDYWPKLRLSVYENFDEFSDKFLSENTGSVRLYMATTKAHKIYTDVRYGADDYIMFGPESRGIPEEILVKHEDNCIRIPMFGETRSLNLCNSAAIILYEALRQNDFNGLEKNGSLHRLQWKI